MIEERDPQAHNDQLEVWAAACDRAARNYRHPGNIGPDMMVFERRAKTMDDIAAYLRNNKIDI